ncbi:uncharacterized protein LOC111711958 [Eurytemora carolleeae]|uniref:uncharacterized protein LOC111711958 n=1 Tax=Eurytemora carolleeae TaxID=1294199 RepID=UPI000C757B76|nr:uncharacterized protein LOC111711958 [Eurytemora carolleeae]|eukprot:XP_023342215.1 uncharacterized protein LOC111711958 [Eurytemora affinis]
MYQSLILIFFFIFRALHWLARRKEQEWDQVIRLLKQKEEKLIQAQRTKTLIRVDADHVLSRSLVLPKRQIVITNPATTVAAKVRTSSNQSAQSANSLGDISEEKINTALQKATENLEKGEGQEKPKTPICQGCKNKKSEFVCAGCSNRWYCSRECQVEDWDDHADECSG